MILKSFLSPPKTASVLRWCMRSDEEVEKLARIVASIARAAYLFLRYVSVNNNRVQLAGSIANYFRPNAPLRIRPLDIHFYASGMLPGLNHNLTLFSTLSPSYRQEMVNNLKWDPGRIELYCSWFFEWRALEKGYTYGSRGGFRFEKELVEPFERSESVSVSESEGSESEKKVCKEAFGKLLDLQYFRIQFKLQLERSLPQDRPGLLHVNAALSPSATPPDSPPSTPTREQLPLTYSLPDRSMRLREPFIGGMSLGSGQRIELARRAQKVYRQRWSSVANEFPDSL